MVKSGFEPDQLGVAAQNPHPDRVERAEPRHALDHVADDLADAMLHLARRLVGEGHGENFARAGAAEAENMGDAHGEHAGLAGAGAGQHQHRAVERLDREPLLRIEPGEIRRARPAGARARGDAAGRGGAAARAGWVCFKGSAKGRNTTDSHWENMAPGRGFYEARGRFVPVIQALVGMAMRRPAPSGTGRCACAAFIRASRAAMKSGNGAVFLAIMSTCSTMLSEVADNQPSSA